MDLHLEIITPEKVEYKGDIGLVQVPGVKGRFMVLKDHAPIVSLLSNGIIRVIGKSGKEVFYNCAEGVFECKDNKAVILVNSLQEVSE